MSRHSIFARALCAVLAGATVFVGMPFPIQRAEAHSERVHGLATMLAFEYLKHRKSIGDDSAEHAVEVLRQMVGDAAGSSDPLDRIVLGLDPELVIDDLEAPVRTEPGLSGPVPVGGASELPNGHDGALLGSMVAAVDEHTDIWGSAVHPYQVVVEGVDDTTGPVGNYAIQKWWDWIKDPGNGGCDQADGWFSELTCGLVSFLFSLLFFFATWPVAMLVSIIGNINSDAFQEGIAEDAVSGCDENTYGSLVFKEIPGNAEEKAMLEDDHAFFDAMGIGFDACDEMEEALEEIDEFKIYGAPANTAQVLLTARARMADAILACDADGVDGSQDGMEDDVIQCVDEPAKIRSHFRALEPYSLSHEGTSRHSDAAAFSRRWRMSNFYTSFTHFQDVLSPTGGAVDFSDPNTTIQVMKAPVGTVHPFDGYSLGEGKKFKPTPSLMDKLPPFTSEGVDGEIIAASKEFELESNAADGHLILRRRVCFDGATGDDTLAGLLTTDGLGISDCSPTGATPKGFSTALLPEEIHAPAEIGALDGHILWTHGALAPQLSYFDGSNVETFTYYNSFLPMVLRFEDEGLSLGSPMFLCDDPIGCHGNDARYVSWMTQLLDPSNTGHLRAMRIRGLALAIHMVQDLSVPHHIAPTTGYGHKEFESWFGSWLWPQSETVSKRDPDILFDSGISGSLGDETVTGDRWGIGASGTASTELYEAILEAAVATNFFDEVTAAWNQLEQHMAALATPTCPADKFAIRRLARAMAFETAKNAVDAADIINFHGPAVTAAEIDSGGFWAVSAMIADHQSSTTGSAVGTSAWIRYSKKALPLLVAATALILENGVQSLEDPSHTCDGGGSSGPPPAPHGSQPLSAPSCTAERYAQVVTCLEDPSPSACAPFQGVASFQACVGKLHVAPDCGFTAMEIARCSCQFREPREIERCVDRRLTRGERDRYLDSKQIDPSTHLALTDATVTLVDGDRDGIPDLSDACPSQGGGPAIGRSGLASGVCLLDAERRGHCRYGCPAPTPSESRDGD